MPTCRHCGRPTAWWRTAHPTCQSAYADGLTALQARLAAVAVDAVSAELRRELDILAADTHVPPADVDRICVSAYQQAVDRALDDNLLSVAEADHLAALRTALGLDPTDPALRTTHDRLKQAALLREIVEGAPLTPLRQDDYASFALAPNEVLVGRVQDVDLYTSRQKDDRTAPHRRHPVAQGVYLATRAFHRRSRDLRDLTWQASGVLGISDRRLLFRTSRAHAFDAPWAELTSVVPFEDGLELRDTAGGVRVLLTRDAWFAGNLAVNLARRAGVDLSVKG